MIALHYASCANRYAKSVTQTCMNWNDFGELWLSSHDTRDCKDGCGLIFAKFASPLRTAANVASVTALALDIDGKQNTPPRFEEAVKRLESFDLMAGAWTTFQHTESSPRYRLLVPLAEPMTPKALPFALHSLANVLGLSAFMDNACIDPARLFYAPSCPANQSFEARIWLKLSGRALPPQQFVSQLEMTERLTSRATAAARKRLTRHNPNMLLERAVSEIAGAKERNVCLNRWAFIVGMAVSRGEIDATEAKSRLMDASLASGLPVQEARYTIERAMRQGGAS